MKLFENYITDINNVLSKKANIHSRGLNENLQFNEPGQILIKSSSAQILEAQNNPKVLFNYDKTSLQRYFGVNNDSFSTISIGPHPDFQYLTSDKFVYHHCVSVFVDIKGSTRLIEKYSLEEVRLIKDSLLTLAIRVANQFGGHVHRLQGDGIFLQFVRKDKNHLNALINALNATSILTQFVSVDLANMLQQYDIKPIKIRAGIDFGNDEKVLWSYYGIPNCEELTTTSLHTDMAAKLQGKAHDNTILIGGNVKSELDLKSDFWKYFTINDGSERVYNISGTFTYPFYEFDWKTYLYSFPFICKSSDGKTLELKDNLVYIECYLSDQDDTNIERYYPNSFSIPKDKKITFKLKRANSDYYLNTFEKIEWRAFNSGKQAESSGSLRHDFEKLYNDKNYCKTTAFYLGHHYVECKIILQHSQPEIHTFPLFIQ